MFLPRPNKVAQLMWVMKKIKLFILVLWAFLFHNPSKCTKKRKKKKKKRKRKLRNSPKAIIPCDNNKNQSDMTGDWCPTATISPRRS